MKLSRSQLSYITAIDALKAIGATQTTISEFLDVKRPTVNVALKSLVEKGYIYIKGKNDKILEYGLTDLGDTILKELQREKSLFFSVFHDYLKFDEILLTEEYDKLFGRFTPEFLDKLEVFVSNGFQNISPPLENQKRALFPQYPNGRYLIPFQVRKFGESTPSMGNKGFIHPAVVVLDDTTCELILQSKIFRYPSPEGTMLKGYLKSLSIYYNDAWHKAEVRDENHFVIPMKRLLYLNNDRCTPERGHINIKAESSAKRMPVSVAEITFDFTLMKPENEAE